MYSPAKVRLLLRLRRKPCPTSCAPTSEFFLSLTLTPAVTLSEPLRFFFWYPRVRLILGKRGPNTPSTLRLHFVSVSYSLPFLSLNGRPVDSNFPPHFPPINHFPNTVPPSPVEPFHVLMRHFTSIFPPRFRCAVTWYPTRALPCVPFFVGHFFFYPRFSVC